MGKCGESHPEQRGHGSSRESRGESCEERKGFPLGEIPVFRRDLPVSMLTFSLIKTGATCPMLFDWNGI